MHEAREHLASSRAGTRVPLATLFSAVLLTAAVLLVTGAAGIARGEASCEQYGCPIADQEGAEQAVTREEPAPSDPAGTPAQQQYEPAPIPPNPEPAPAPTEQYAIPATPTPEEPVPYQGGPVDGSAQYQAPVGGAQPAPGQGPGAIGESSPLPVQQPSQGLASEADRTTAPEPPAGSLNGEDIATAEPTEVANADENGNEESAVPATPADDDLQPAEEAELAATSADEQEPEGGAEEPPPSPTDVAGTVEQPPAGEAEQEEEPPAASSGPVEECTVSSCGELADPFYGDCAIYETAVGARVIGCTITLEPEFQEPGQCPRQTEFFLPAGVLAGGYDGDSYTPYAPYATKDACQGDPLVPPEPPTGWWYVESGAHGPGSYADCYDAQGTIDRHCGLDVPPRYLCAVYGETVDGTVRGCITGPDYRSGNGWCWPVSTYSVSTSEQLGTYTECAYKDTRKMCGKNQCGVRPPAPDHWGCTRWQPQYGTLYEAPETRIFCINPDYLTMLSGDEPWDATKVCFMNYDEQGEFMYKVACEPGGGETEVILWAVENAGPADDTLDGGGTGKDGGQDARNDGESNVLVEGWRGLGDEDANRTSSGGGSSPLDLSGSKTKSSSGYAPVGVPNLVTDFRSNWTSPIAVDRHTPFTIFSSLLGNELVVLPHGSGENSTVEDLVRTQDQGAPGRDHKDLLYPPEWSLGARTTLGSDAITAVLQQKGNSQPADELERNPHEGTGLVPKNAADISDALAGRGAPEETGEDTPKDAERSSLLVGLGRVAPVLVVAALSAIVVARRRFIG